MKLRIGEINETEFYDPEFLNDFGIQKVSAVYLFLEDELTFICSTSPSYFGRFLYNIVDTVYDGGSPEDNTAYDAVDELCHEDDYFNFLPQGVTVDYEKDEDETIDEFCENAVDYYRSNHVL